jgi:hypothetical protein
VRGREGFIAGFEMQGTGYFRIVRFFEIRNQN